MRATLIVATCIILASLCAAEPPPTATSETGRPTLEQRWFFSFGYGRNREDVETIKSLIDTAAAHGLNGMVLSSFGFDSITRWDEGDFALLEEIATRCRNRQIELIPTGFSAGYGGGVLGHDRSFAAALPTRAMLTARGDALLPVAGENLLINGDLEDHAGDQFPGYIVQDQPGEVSFADESAATGQTSIRYENFTANEHGHGRLAQRVVLRAGGSYRVAFRLKTLDLAPASRFTVQVLAGSRTLARVSPKVASTQDWSHVALDFISTRNDTVNVYAGIWGGESGAFWLDDFRVQEEASLADIARRQGTPVELRSLDRDIVFVEGRDYEPIRNLRDLEHLSRPPTSAIQEGERLLLSCYRIPYVGHSWGRQTSLCMSNPGLYEYWEAQARRLHEVLPYQRVLLAMDEIRNGGGCALCQDRGLSMAEILGDCFTRQHAIFQRIDPDIEVLAWSDMLDPAHNAHADYYGVVGDYTGSWQHVPQEITMMSWYHKIRDESLGFFSSHGFGTFGAAYYDADNLTGSEEWLRSLERTTGARGIMYTTWDRKYELLGAFGDLVSAAPDR